MSQISQTQLNQSILKKYKSTIHHAMSSKNDASSLDPRHAGRLAVQATLEARELLVPRQVHQGQRGGREVGEVLDAAGVAPEGQANRNSP